MSRDAIDPRSLAARLIDVTFVFDAYHQWEVKVPKSLSIYSVMGMLGKRLGVMPTHVRLAWETGERDPLGHGGNNEGLSGWDSDEAESELDEPQTYSVAREVELVASTRTLGTYIEGREARVRVERR